VHHELAYFTGTNWSSRLRIFGWWQPKANMMNRKEPTEAVQTFFVVWNFEKNSIQLSDESFGMLTVASYRHGNIAFSKNHNYFI
jgi:hypothetical protein